MYTLSYNCLKCLFNSCKNCRIVYKKTYEWYTEWQRVTTNDSEWYNERQKVVQLVTRSGTTSDNDRQRVTTNNTEWQRVVISANFPFFRIKKEPTSKQSKENCLNLEEDNEEVLLN